MKPEQSKKPDEPTPLSGVAVGDDMYFNHAGQPSSGHVLAHGKHGCTFDHDGKHRRVKWEHVLGHKKRATQRYSIVDQGEDGMIVEDANGGRQFIGIENEARENPMVMKSLDGRQVLFLKADGPIVNRPGLSKKQITDKTGRQQTKWVRTNKDEGGGERKKAEPEAGAAAVNSAENPKAGDTVQFKAGDFSGSGEVVGEPGVDGAHVKDSTGRIHPVRWSEITGRGEKESAGQKESNGPKKEPMEPDEPQESDGAEGIARALFDTSELDKLPAKAVQPVHSWKELSAKAPEALKEFKGMLDSVAGKLHLDTGRRPQSLNLAQDKENGDAKDAGKKPKKLDPNQYMLPEHWDNDTGFLFMGPLKGEKRAKEKVDADYGGDWSQVKDMVRATIAVPMVTQIPKVLQSLKEAGIHLAQKPKNNLVKPLPGGYRDINLIVKMPNGLLAELQIHVKPMTLAKEKGHKAYETSRSIEAKYAEKGLAGHKDKWDASDREQHDKAMGEQESIYGDAWKKATTPASKLIKSLNSDIILLWKSPKLPRGQNGRQIL